MVEKWREQDLYRKILLVVLALSVLAAVLGYALVGSQQGIWYGEAFLRRTARGEDTVYSGQMDGKEISFTVQPSGAVWCTVGDWSGGPFTVKEDPSAAPDADVNPYYFPFSGVEIRCAGEVYFRGGSFQLAGARVVYREDGQGLTLSNDAAAHPVVHVLLDLAEGPALVSRGDVQFLLFALLFAALGVVSILFADPLFRFSLRVSIKDPEFAEPSDWELLSRGIGQTIGTVAAVVCAVACVLAGA